MDQTQTRFTGKDIGWIAYDYNSKVLTTHVKGIGTTRYQKVPQTIAEKAIVEAETAGTQALEVLKEYSKEEVPGCQTSDIDHPALCCIIPNP